MSVPNFIFIKNFIEVCSGVQLLIMDTGSGKGLMASGDEPLSEPMLVNILDAIRRHYAAVS